MEYHKTITLKDGRACTLRNGTAEDGRRCSISSTSPMHRRIFYSHIRRSTAIPLRTKRSCCGERQTVPMKSNSLRLLTVR